MEQKFEYNSLPVRTVTDGEDQTWFAGIDVCNILGYVDKVQPIEKLDEDAKKLDRITDGSGQLRKTWMVNEFGLYSLILSSEKSEAKLFKKWVCHEVLPAIRKAGKYTTEQEKEHEMSLKMIAAKIESLRNEREEQQKIVNDLKKEIEKQTTAMIDFIQRDRNQLTLPFPQ